MISPDHCVIRDFLRSGDDNELANNLLNDDPWLFHRKKVDFGEWAKAVLTDNGIAQPASLKLLGSAATGFSLAPEKAGAPFRDVAPGVHASDLDLAIVSEAMYLRVWNDLVSEDSVLGARNRSDTIRVRVYWGRIDQAALPRSQRANIRKIVDSVQRHAICRGHEASIRLYRRHEDLLAYSKWCLRQLRKVVNHES
ncbi:MAG: hypothetical protein UZ17_ACD001001659 [Acidobacteria bacterium OLB17]|nr:MAG: hypothetical protein UZ17_ACD001001659 [Acidobacteria bacterium OLB17]